MNSFRRSSVKAGMVRRTALPSLVGLRPSDDSRMPFSIDASAPESHGWMTSGRGSGTVMLATSLIVTLEPMYSTGKSWTIDGLARPVRMAAASFLANSSVLSKSFFFALIRSLYMRPILEVYEGIFKQETVVVLGLGDVVIEIKEAGQDASCILWTA